MRVRRGDAPDSRSIARLSLQVQALHVRHEPAIFRQPSLAEVEEWVSAQLADGWRATVAAVEGTVVGYALVELVDRPPGTFTHPAIVGHLHQIGVEVDHRGRGIGRAVLEHACADAARAGAVRIGLETWSFNEEARAFFLAAGFEPFNVRLRRPL